MGAILAFGLFVQTSKAITIFYHIVSGFAFTSWAIFGASFFKRAQLSGITVTIFTLVLTIIAQAYDVDINNVSVNEAEASYRILTINRVSLLY